jgi:REP element-mobilizing transposase RayT
MFRISKDSPVHYITAVTNNRLGIFQKDSLKGVLIKALKEARNSANLLIFAYVIMPDHFHALIGSDKKPSEVLRYVNGISGHRIINFLKDAGYESSLKKLKHATKDRQHKDSVWDHHPNLKLISTENVFIEKANYIHMSPVRGAWWSVQRNIVGPVIEFGSVGPWMMNRY